MDKIRKYAPWTIILVLVVLCTVLTVKSFHRPSLPPETVVVTDTITSVRWDTVYQTRTVVEKLQVHDTLNQLVYRDSVITDSVFVDLPILQYHADTSLHQEDMDLQLCITASGYNVTIDEIQYGISYTIPTVKKRHRVGFFVGPVVGVGYDPFTGKACPAVGVGCSIGITLKKY